MEFEWAQRPSAHPQGEQPAAIETLQKPLLSKTQDIEGGLQDFEYSWKDYISVLTLLGHPPSGQCNLVCSIIRGVYAFLMSIGIPVFITVVEYHSHGLKKNMEVLQFRLFVRVVEALLGAAAYTCLWTVFHYDSPHVVLGTAPLASFDVDWEKSKTERQTVSLETRKRSLLQERHLNFSAPRENLVDYPKLQPNHNSLLSSNTLPRYWKPPRKSFILLGFLVVVLSVLQGIWRSQRLSLKYWYIWILSPLAFIFQASNFILGCIIFWIICKKLTARLQKLSEALVMKANVGAPALIRQLEIHKIIVSETHTLSYRFRAFVLCSTALVLVDFYVYLYVIIEKRELLQPTQGGDLILSNCVAFFGLVVLIRAAAKITHQSKRLSIAFSSAHARVTAESTLSFFQTIRAPVDSNLSSQQLPPAQNNQRGKKAFSIPMKSMEKSSSKASIDANESASSSTSSAQDVSKTKSEANRNQETRDASVDFQWSGSDSRTIRPSYTLPASNESHSSVTPSEDMIAKLASHTLEYQTRSAILRDLEISKAGFSLYGFLVDRSFIQYTCAVLITLTSFVATQALVPR